MNEQNIHSVFISGERITLGYKEVQKRVSNSLKETYSAFTNTHGKQICYKSGLFASAECI